MFLGVKIYWLYQTKVSSLEIYWPYQTKVSSLDGSYNHCISMVILESSIQGFTLSIWPDRQAWVKSLDTYQMLHNGISDLDLHCLPFSHLFQTHQKVANCS